jgi:hypothetical protein
MEQDPGTADSGDQNTSTMPMIAQNQVVPVAQPEPTKPHTSIQSENDPNEATGKLFSDKSEIEVVPQKEKK